MRIKKHKPLNILTLFLLAGIIAQAADLDFETVPGAIPFEGMVISNQFQPYFGVRFTGLRSNDFPVIAKRGFPAAAYGANGQDD